MTVAISGPSAARAERHAFLSELVSEVLLTNTPPEFTVRALIRAWHTKSPSTWTDAAYAKGVITRWLRDEVARGVLTRHHVPGGLNGSTHSIYRKIKVST